ncbi:aldehyde dehydrogenase family protein [Granulicoccus phenolivorans]|uniref:aldehyde dehydrogenase family protein n=1 Tax=Granulicoccus phenolivorans TaxID=266854 RepID=UPI0003F8D7B3|nr:aldehyde dehydrogenase family protein [Granulicoccus phenolivorans]
MSTVTPVPTPSDRPGPAGSGFPTLDSAIQVVRAGSAAWGALSAAERAAVLAEVHQSMVEVADSWARTACEIKGIPFAGPYAGEEWMSGPYAALAGTGALAATLADLAAGRSPLHDATITPAPGDRSRIRVLPHDRREAILMHGFSAEVWTLPHVTAEQARERAGLGIAAGYPQPGVGIVLGAGNITSIAPLDVLYELVAYGRGVVLKVNPILAGMMTVLSQALSPLIRDGYLRIVQGGAAEGAYLTSHPDIDHVHITGSAATHDAIVWGTGADAARRRAAGTPRLTVPISSELGGVSPVIVVPGRWSPADLRFQAEHIATMRLHNAGHNCIAGQVVILSSDWEQRDAFLTELRDVLRRVPARASWYPGSAARVTAAGERPSAESFGDGRRVLVTPETAEEQDWLENTELFAAVLGVVELPGTGDAFVQTAIDHANEHLAGTLGANILIDPQTQRSIGPARFDDLLADLRYGTIGVNVWTGFGFLAARAPWGAFPGHTLTDVGSGTGVVHNALLIDDVERSVVRGPFRPFPRSVLGGEFSLFPKPPWFMTVRTAPVTSRRLTGFAAHPSWGKLPAIFASAFRG